MDVHYVLVFLVLFCVAVALSNQEDAGTKQYRKDLRQINYYNLLLHRHRTEKQKIEKVNSDIKSSRLLKLQDILETKSPRSISLIATDSQFEQINQLVHPVGRKPVTENIEELTNLLAPQRRQSRNKQNDSAGNAENLVEFQLSEREYEKFAKFLDSKTMKKKVI